MFDGKLAWYVARSSGWVAFVLLAVTVLWGILGISKIIERRGLPRWMLDVHRFVALLTVLFTGIHLLGLVGDNWMRIAWKEIFLPMAIPYRPGAVAWGIVAMYLLAAVQVTSWLRRFLPRRVWRGAHLLAYPAFWMVAVHGLRAGTDAPHDLVRGGVMVVVAVVAFVTVMRITMSAGRRAGGASAPVATADPPPPARTLVGDAPSRS